MISWLERAKKVFSVYDGFFLCSYRESEVVLWPPSLVHYPCSQELTKVPELFSATVDEGSFFRVCAQSLMPYHGYVVPSPIHDRLYETLGTTQPEHVTLLPILHGDGILGFLYMEKKTVDDPSAIPPLSQIEYQWDVLSHLFVKIYQPDSEKGFSPSS